MRDRRLGQVLHMDDKEDIRRAIKIAFEPVRGLVVGLCVSSAFAPEKVPVFDPKLMLIDVISSMDGIVVIETPQERCKTLNIPLSLQCTKVQRHEPRR